MTIRSKSNLKTKAIKEISELTDRKTTKKTNKYKKGYTKRYNEETRINSMNKQGQDDRTTRSK
jgi:hypothetical protein